LKFTKKGGQPDVGEPVKLAKGTCAVKDMEITKDTRKEKVIFLPAK
jgi:hypothetical protein